MLKVQRILASFVLVGLLVLAAGCGDGDKRSRASGVVSYKNEPLKGGNIGFSNDIGGTYKGFIQPDGTYTITDIPNGTYAVTIETETLNPEKKGPPQGPPGDKNNMQAKMQAEYLAKMGQNPGGGATAGPSKEDLAKVFTKIPSKYATKSTSGLQIEIGATGALTKKDFPLVD